MKDNFIKFLGTAGARFVMIKQLRSSGGIWINFNSQSILIDPGPGCIVRLADSRPRLNASNLDAVILTHRHLDHANDVNVMIEAMTDCWFNKKGILFVPQDALIKDSVVLKHAQKFVKRIELLKPGKSYRVGAIKFKVPCRMKHPVETYSLTFNFNKDKVSFISDTQYYKGLASFFRGSNIIILNVVFLNPRKDIQHLDLISAETLIKEINPQKAILTHFGMSMLKAGPGKLAGRLTKRLGIDVLAAYDGMEFDLLKG